MKKEIIFPLLSLFLLSFLFTDEKPVLYPIESVNEGTKIFATGNYVDEKGEKLEFILEKPSEIKAFLKGLKFGDYKPFIGDDSNELNIELIQDHKRVEFWSLNVKEFTFNVEYLKSYEVDIDFFKQLHKKHPLEYRYEKKSFGSKQEFDDYNKKQFENKKFIYSQAPLFRYEGSFEIQFPKSSKFLSPLAIDKYIRPMVTKIESDQDKFTIGYILDANNFNNTDQFTITISGPKKIFDNLKVDELENKNWKLTDEVAFFYYKK